MSHVHEFDNWFRDDGPAALVMRQHLAPVEGIDGVFFPATYAAQLGADRDKDKFQGGYSIDYFEDKTNVCLVDSVGSQANRIEPIFAREGYTDLVPQIFVTFPEHGIRLNLLYANHRAADAIVRCSAYEKELRLAFLEILRGNYEKLAKFAPTSLVFGVWDSRDTYAKVPRLVSSTIRAFNVRPHTRSANFLTQMTIDLAKLGIMPDAESKDGFANALASKAPGGVQLSGSGSIRRDATLGLAPLRRLTVLEQDGTLAVERTQALRRYILGLSLVALTAPQESYLRQGCNLVPDGEKPREFVLVNYDGKRVELPLTHLQALEYARSTAQAFHIGPNREEKFDATIADKASEEKPVKLKGEVLAVDAGSKTLKLKIKGKEHDVAVNDETVILKDKVVATFDTALTVGCSASLEVLKGVALTIAVKK